MDGRTRTDFAGFFARGHDHGLHNRGFFAYCYHRPIDHLSSHHRERIVILFDLIDSAYAMGSSPGGGSANPIASLLPFVLMFAVLYLLILRPQMKKQKNQQKMIDELQKGDEIVTSGGIHGTILNLKDDIIVLKLAENVKIELSRAAVSRVKNKEQEK